MPTVTKYGSRRIQPVGLPQARLQTPGETEVSAGGSLARARGRAALRTADSVESLATPVLSMSLEEIARQKAEERKASDETALLKASNQLAAWKTKRLYDTETGAFAQQGEAALPLPEQLHAEYDQVTSAIGTTMKTPEQELAFQKLKAQEWQSIDLQVRRHVFGEMQTFRTNELKAYVGHKTDSAIRNALDPKLVADDLQAAITAVRTNGPTLGLGPDAITEQVAAIESGIHVGVVSQLLALNKSRQAKQYFALTREAIAGTQVDDVQRALTEGSLRDEAEAASDLIYAEDGPKTDQDTIEIDKLADRARAMFPDDADLQKATIQSLQSRVQLTTAGRAARLDTAQTTLWELVYQKVSYETIRRHPLAVKNPEVMLKIRDYLDSDQARQESRLAARESREAAREGRAAARESRIYTAEVRREHQLEMNGWARYYDLSTVESLRRLTPGAIMDETQTLGQAHVARLLKDKQDRTKSDLALRQAEADQEMFSERGYANGFTYIRAPKGNEQKATIGRLRAAVNDAIGLESLAKARPLLPAEQRKTMDDVFAQKVMLNDWGYDTEIPAVLVNPADIDKVYVPYDTIPDTTRQQYENYFKGAAPVSAAVKKQRMERAYGIYLTPGSTNAQIEAALQGTTSVKGVK